MVGREGKGKEEEKIGMGYTFHWVDETKKNGDCRVYSLGNNYSETPQ